MIRRAIGERFSENPDALDVTIVKGDKGSEKMFRIRHMYNDMDVSEKQLRELLDWASKKDQKPEQKYFLVWVDDGGYDNYIYSSQVKILAKGSLKEVLAAREAAGALVVDDNGNIVQDDCWLFDWEKSARSCYAREKMVQKLKVKLPRHALLDD